MFYYVCPKEKNNCVPQCNFMPYSSKYFRLNKIFIKMFCAQKFLNTFKNDHNTYGL